MNSVNSGTEENPYPCRQLPTLNYQIDNKIQEFYTDSKYKLINYFYFYGFVSTKNYSY